MSEHSVRRTSLSSLLGTRVRDAQGAASGRVAEMLVETQESGTHITGLVISDSGKARDKAAYAVPLHELSFRADGAIHLKGERSKAAVEISPSSVRLEYDLLDQQIIDVHGRKVVRVNDVDLVWEQEDDTLCKLRIAEVEVGMRGAVRRLLKGLPHGLVEAVAHQFQARVIPWEFVDLIDRDPSRRVRLRVEGNRLSNMHPSDIAEILEELARAEGRPSWWQRASIRARHIGAMPKQVQRGKEGVGQGVEVLVADRG